MLFINSIISNNKLKFAIEEERAIESNKFSFEEQKQQSEELLKDDIDDNNTDTYYDDEYAHTPAIEPDKFVSFLLKLIRIYESFKRI